MKTNFINYAQVKHSYMSASFGQFSTFVFQYKKVLIKKGSNLQISFNKDKLLQEVMELMIIFGCDHL